MRDPSVSAPPSPVLPSPRTVAEAFARALDEGDLGHVGQLLASECECHDGALHARGAEAVLAVYRAAASWTERGFDDVRHVSAVAAAPEPAFRVEVTSMLMRMPGRWHRLRHRRELTVDSGGHIVTIVHTCEPAAAEAFRAFVRGCDVPPPPPGFGV